MHASSSMSHPVKWMDREVGTGSAVLAFKTIMRAFNEVKKMDPETWFTDIIICDDAGVSFRKSIYDGYKGNRRKKKQTQAEEEAMVDMFVMKNVLLHVFSLLGCKVFHKWTLEADDVIGWITRYSSSRKVKSCILTSDADLAQLIDDYTSMLRPEKDELMHYTKKNMEYMVLHTNKAKSPWGCKTAFDVILYKSLVGDTSDNYPGVPGFGGSKWLKLKEYLDANDMTSLDVLRDPDKAFLEYSWLGTKAAQSVFAMYEKHRDMFFTCRKLARIQRRVRAVEMKTFFRHPDSTGPNDPLNAVKQGAGRGFDQAIAALDSYDMFSIIETLENFEVMGAFE